MDDARRVAAVLVEQGAGAVLVFGSVARGNAAASSDLDLVVVFDDLGDYSCRDHLRASLTETARHATTAPVDLWVTDRPHQLEQGDRHASRQPGRGP
ncbi:MAG: nucleotidyltransferase domain-containing protein [Acidimicrobiia bacterium]|nr:nucleotidyltransferase domain-containing protein [Acidimicrobiia bacterium]MXZ84457.1 nucleotidyltransferase domain-containing protein [Acidimicrobiia bacterium]MYB08505.1 nucleotidyltransferase domain-containing protein [Acidimicrobiia bacterium]MYE74641.1 nucleotidyltransferase domain-containing protein [Acidimicrobiia bacterium]MYG57775.1 nucleotidyltransferase domain-containing protein [Acidimicrobiia bacterium]